MKAEKDEDGIVFDRDALMDKEQNDWPSQELWQEEAIVRRQARRQQIRPGSLTQGKQDLDIAHEALKRL